MRSKSLEDAFRDVYLPSEETIYEATGHRDEEVSLSVYTRGRWWHFSFLESELPTWDMIADAVRQYIAANVMVTTMYGS